MEPHKLARLWIYAIVLSAAVNTMAAGFILVLSRMTSGRLDFGEGLATGFFAFAGVVGAMSAAVFGWLTGRVLDCKLPAFRTQSWIAAHTSMGFVFGSIVFLTSAVPNEASLTTTTDIAWHAAGIGVFGVVVCLLSGCVQAFVLRRAARGLGPWIGYSILGGACSLIIVPIDIYGPSAGIARDLSESGAGFLLDVVHGMVLLPALFRLRPRADHAVPMVFE